MQAKKSLNIYGIGKRVATTEKFLGSILKGAHCFLKLARVACAQKRVSASRYRKPCAYIRCGRKRKPCDILSRGARVSDQSSVGEASSFCKPRGCNLNEKVNWTAVCEEAAMLVGQKADKTREWRVNKISETSTKVPQRVRFFFMARWMYSGVTAEAIVRQHLVTCYKG